MEPPKRKKYSEDEIFYSDSEAENELNGTLNVVSTVRTAFRLGHTQGTEDVLTYLIKTDGTQQEHAPRAAAISDEMERKLSDARNQSRYSQRYTEQVMDTLDLVRSANARLVKRVMEMERQARHHELVWKSIQERVRIQEYIIQELDKKIKNTEVDQPNGGKA